jgi:hypothetical protein
MTERGAGMTEGGSGMTEGESGMAVKCGRGQKRYYSDMGNDDVMTDKYGDDRKEAWE